MADYLVEARAHNTWQQPVEDKDLTTSPSVSKGARYIIAGTGGAWSGGTINDIAQYNGATWDFYTPVEGWKVYVKDEDVWYFYDGSSWSDNLTIGGDLQVDGGDIKDGSPTIEDWYKLTTISPSSGTDVYQGLAINGTNGGSGWFRAWGENDNYFIEMWGASIGGTIDTYDSSWTGAGTLGLQSKGNKDIRCFPLIEEGQTSDFRIYGYPTGGAKKYGSLKIDDTTSDFHIGAENDIVLNPTGGNVKVEAKLETNDEFKMKVYAQTSEPTLSADEFMAIWKDTDDANKIYLLFRRGTGDQVSVELA